MDTTPFSLSFLSIKFRSKQKGKKTHESITLSTNLKESYPALLPKVTKTLENLNNGQINQCNSVEVGSSSSLGLADKLWLSGSAEMQIHMLRDGWRRCSGFSHVPQGPSMFGWKN